MTAITPHEDPRRTRTGVSRAVGVPIVAMLLAAFGLLATLNSPASADTPNVTPTISASVGSQSNVHPNGPLTALSDGSVVTIRVTQASGSDPIFSLSAIRQCEANAPISNTADMGPSNTGFCLSSPLSPGTNNVVTNVVKANSSDDFIETTFKVGTGTEAVSFDDGSATGATNTITCDSTHDCSLWIAIGVTGGTDLVHYDLHFGSGTTTTTAAVTTTTAAVTTTTAAGGTTTTTAAGGTTTTTAAGGTTTTTAAGGTTTTTAAGGSTTTTVACAPQTGSTTTTLPAGTIITCTAPAGGNLSVVSTGWTPGSTVTNTLHSDPVALAPLVADGTGKIAGSLAVPANTPVGAHTLVLTGTGPTAATARTISAGVTITAAASTTTAAGGATTTTVHTTTPTVGSSGGSGLAVTGSNVAKVLMAALLVACAGWLLLGSAVHRRDRLGSAR